jgi:hypothetical protein
MAGIINLGSTIIKCVIKRYNSLASEYIYIIKENAYIRQTYTGNWENPLNIVQEYIGNNQSVLMGRRIMEKP